MKMKTKIIIFKYNRGWNDVIKEEIEFDVDATDVEIDEAYSTWMIGHIADSCTWYEKE
jgi:hypothetical protein